MAPWLTDGIDLAARLAYLAIILATVLRAVLRPMREPAARLAWVIVIIVLPLVGVAGYLLLGEPRISLKRREAYRRIDRALPRPPGDPAVAARLGASPYAAPFAIGRSATDLPPTQGNSAAVLPGNVAAIAGIVDDIDRARETVHIAFYIWLADASGLAVKDALVRAAARGVRVRVLADALGSRAFHRSAHWQDMRDAGVDARVALPVGGLVWTLIRGRVDLRNHRKIVVIDNRLAWCGSQNCADPEFRVKARYAPWVDVMVRWEGPVARDTQLLFAADWMAEGGDDLSPLLLQEPPAPAGDIIAQVIGTGPASPFTAMPVCFAALIHSAREELVITTPYFVPDEQLLAALIAAGRRGVRTILILPARNDSRIVAAASRSVYADLLAAGVEIHEFLPGLLHAKTMIVDGKIGLIGSANLDRRSFELNFENNVLFADGGLAGQIRRRQDEWLAQSRPITAGYVAGFSLPKRLWQNLLGMMAPLL